MDVINADEARIAEKAGVRAGKKFFSASFRCSRPLLHLLVSVGMRCDGP
jgi:hypothetical protein